jgi:copper oxidase (laccase) domain-containing protein
MQDISAFFSNSNNNKITAGYTNNKESLILLLKHLGLNSLPLVQMKQVHANHLAEITSIDQATAKNVDAMFTFKTNVCLAVRWADCLPILFSHSSGLLGVIHAGRRGTKNQITKKTLQKIKSVCNITSNQPLSVWFGPRICSECYQVDKLNDLHFDLVKENELQLFSVLDENQVLLLVEPKCTHCGINDFHSYRRDGVGVSMNYAVISQTNSLVK